MPSLRNVFILNHFINKLDKEIGVNGLQSAMMKVIKISGAKFEIFNKNKEISNILGNKPVVVIANHPAEFEVIVMMASLVNRKDLYLIANSSFLHIGANLDKHLIPVHISHNLATYTSRNLRIKFLKKFTDILPYQEAHQKNIASIKDAISKVNNNGMVVIFPGDHDDRWQPGVGYLLKGITNKNTQIIRTFIKGTSNWDYFRIIPFFSKLLPKIEVSFAPPLSINSIPQAPAREIVSKLEKDYLSWTENLITY